MKSPLMYLTAVKLKNQLKEAVKHPAKLIYIIFIAAALVLSTIGGQTNAEHLELRPLQELTAIMVLFYSLMFLITFINGVNGGAGNYPMFTLSDVSVLFPSPLRPNKVLFYGLFRQLGLSLLLGFFLLFQYNWMHGLYGVEYGHLIFIVLGYGLSLFLGQVCAMAAYVRSSGNDNARRVVKYCVYGVTLGFVVWMLARCLPGVLAVSASGSLSEEGGFLLTTEFTGLLEEGTNFLATIGIFFPVSGWAAGLIGGVFAQEWLTAGLCALLIAAAFLVALLLVVKNKNNYYEDVLQTAEVAQSAITAKKEGLPAEMTPKKVRLGKTGLERGRGASAIFFKHQMENRRSGVLMFSKTSIIFMLVIIGCSMLYNTLFEAEEPSAVLVAVFAMSTYMQIFSESAGRFNWELTKPYIYLIPEPPLKKLLWAIGENLVADVCEAVVIYVPVALIIGLGPVDMLMCIVARVSFALLFISGNMLVERVFGSVRSKGLMLLFYFLAMIILALPGVGLGIAVMAIELLPGVVGVLAGITLGNIPVALLVMFLCRNLLQYSEYNGR
ncbi:putative ABC exporter domain-containing protein [Acutalibacter intestini]|uniref:putative ABC exporter domain-containing protein n=1 Tax=Acutalibacter intestini TaxID=3093659 RepID=UPI002AC8D62E|nr:putative ABC exporter domain-containing protein [Acutalibacter sp. M00204]